MIKLLLISFLLLSQFIYAENKLNSFELTSETPYYENLQNEIESILSENSIIFSFICENLNDPSNLSHTLGLDMQRSILFIKKCTTTSISKENSKIFKKRFFVFSDEKNEYSSWTTQDNITYLNEKIFINKQDLYNALLHEIAIAFDAKMQIFFTHAKKYSPLSEITYTLKEENNLKLLFKNSLYKPIAFTFAAMRAFYIESADFRNQILTNENCQIQFIRFFNSIYFSKIIFENKNDSDIMNDLFTLISENNKPQNIEIALNEILNTKAKVSNQLNFCQYMSVPLLSNNSKFLFSANGPRPKVGTGWSTVTKQNADGSQFEPTEIDTSSRDEKTKFIFLNGKVSLKLSSSNSSKKIFNDMDK